MAPNPRMGALSFHGLKHGESTYLRQSGDTDSVKVSYHRRQSQGDNGRNVPGAYTGAYTVEYPGGRTSVHDHGPHATTEGAARRGANPNAKAYAAEQAHNAVRSHFASKAMGFNDRRGQ